MAAAVYPVRVEAALDPQISRWLWLVKWLLAIPHFVLLAFLWIAFVLVGVLAFFAILFTGRYPRPLFDFNLGVLRWTWRVSYYTYGALGTDRYPPFTLAEVPDYPAHLEVSYPEHLSRGLVLVKWWLLAIPHYLVVGFFIGGTWAVWRHADNAPAAGGGLIGLLVFFAGVMLLVTGRYPQQIFDFVLGMNRWVLRVAAYAGLMTDEYPPFRLDMGGHESVGTVTVPPPAPAPAETSPTGPEAPYGVQPPPASDRRRGWTPWRIVSLVVGCILGLVSFGLLAGGGVATWATNTQRDATGFLTSNTHGIDTASYAITTGDIDFGSGQDAVTPADVLGTLRIRATATDLRKPVFIGVAPKAAVDAYLASVSHETVTGWSPFGTTSEASAGGAPRVPPVAAQFWTAKSVGRGTQVLAWRPSGGSWVAVVMNPAGGSGVAVTADVGATVPDLAWVAVGLFVAGGVLLGIAVAMVAISIARASR